MSNSHDQTLSRILQRRMRRSFACVSVASMLAMLPATGSAAIPTKTGSDAARTSETVHRFALVVGSNTALSKGQSPLRFADDDAARMAELLRDSGASVELLTTFDKESQELFGGLVQHAKTPTRKNLEAAMTRLAKGMNEAGKQGRVEFLFYYSGHGDIGGDGRRHLTLSGERLTRNDLFQTILKRSTADTNHVVIDACQSEKFVLARGEWKDDRARKRHADEVTAYLESNQLSNFPNTGVILASSVDQQTHEWERYRGGIFTHELLSGLRGGADINGDGRVEYSELGAFISSANRGVDDPRARLELTLLPPRSDQRAALVTHKDVATQRVLYFDAKLDAHYSVEDHRGVRVADLHRSPGRPAYLRVPMGELYVYSEAGKSGDERLEARVPSSHAGRIDIATLEFSSTTRRARGALDAAFREGLFEYAYSAGYYDGYTQSESLLSVAEPEWEVRVWSRDDEGDMVEVARVAGDDPDAPHVETVPEGPDAPEAPHRVTKTTVIKRHGPNFWWGSLSAGLEFTPYNPNGSIMSGNSRVTANEFHGFGDTGFTAPLRGVDLRWWTFETDKIDERPSAEGYFRMGYTQGGADFYAPGESRLQGNSTQRLDYFTVPLFFGGNIYAFRHFPVRPFAGAGVGFDVLRLDYRMVDGSRKTDVSARIGFELHAGLDLRINNYFSLVGEVRQLWSARRKLAGVPDFSNEGLTAIGSVRLGFGLNRKRHQSRDGVVIEQTTTVGDPDVDVDVPVFEEPVAAPAPAAVPAPDPAPGPAVSGELGSQIEADENAKEAEAPEAKTQNAEAKAKEAEENAKEAEDKAKAKKAKAAK